MADIKISFNSHCGIWVTFFFNQTSFNLGSWKYQKYKTDNLRNVELLLLCFYAAGFLFEKCNFKVHLVCEINCLGGKHITCWLTLNAENIQQHRMPSKFLILHGIKHLCKFICNNYLTTDYRGPLKQKKFQFLTSRF